MRTTTTHQRISLISLLISILLLKAVSLHATVELTPVDGVLTITVTAPNDLYTNYPAAVITTKGATKLKIVGPLDNYYDFTRLRDVIDETLTQVDLSEAVLPDNTLPSGAFSNEPTLTTVVLPSDLTAIGASAFSGCSALTSVNLPQTLTNIGSYAFNGCSALTSLSFNVTGGLIVASYAFSNCSQLASITINAGGDVTLSTYYGSGVFDGCTALQTFELHTPGKLTSPRAQLFYINNTGGALTTVILDARGAGSSLSNSTFQYCKLLTSVTLPAGLTEIPDNFFYECNALTSVNIPAGLTSIGSNAFNNCSSLTTLDFSGTQLSTIDQNAFSGCSSLSEVLLPASLTSIGSSVFYQCSSLGSMDLSATQITSLPNSIFSQCSSLASVQLPSSINSIGYNAFYNCTSLTGLTLNVTGGLNIGHEVFYNCQQLTTISITAGGDVTQPSSYRPIYNCPALQTFELHTPGKFTSNCSQLFYMNNDGGSLTTVTLDAQGAGSSLQQQAFHYCKLLTSVTLPAGLTTIPNSCFYECNALASVSIPASVTAIGSNAFYNCNALESIDLSQTQVTTIDNSAFSNCTQLASVSLPSSLTSIGSNAFSYCSALTSINLPQTLTTIKSYAFQRTGFSSFTHTSNGPLTIENNAFYDCRQLEDVSLTIGGALTIGGNAFGFGNSSVLRSVTIQAGGDVSISGSNNFKTSNGITMENFELYTPGKVILPDNIFYSYQNNALRRCILDARGAGSTIGQYAFEYCRNLEELLLPAGLVSIGRASFSDCNSLTAIELPATTVIADGYQMFYNCSSLESIDLSQLQITALGSYAFSGCSKLASVQLPGTMTTISDGMFNGCSVLTTINLPDGLTSIGQNAFYGCSSLNISLTVPATVTTMGERAFYNCSSLTSATVNANLATLPSYTFAGCSSLRTVNMTGTTTAIGDYAFDGCGQLVDLTLPSTLTSIGQYAFKDCSSLTMLTLPSTLTTFGNGVFDGCSSLLSIEVPEGVTQLPQSLFSGCTGMQSLYLPSTITEINYSAFSNLSNLIDLHIMATTPPPLDSYSHASEVTLFVPEASITTYQAADNWKDFKYIYAELSNLATLDDDEFALLQAIYQKTNGANWTRPWTLGSTKAETAMPEGVKVSNGHVVQLALVGNGLSGELPQELMQFPQAWYVNVSRNQFTGDIGAYFDAMSPNNVLTQLDLSDNQFTGNIGRMNYLTDKLPALTTLRAARNHIRDVKPVLPAHITTLDLRGQEVDINNHYLFSNFISTTPENLPNLFPSILTYRHDTYRDYGNTLFLLSAPYAEAPWMVEIHKNSNSVSTNRFFYSSTESTDGWNFLPSGEIVYLGNGENNLVDRSRIRLEFNYAMGDIDYNGTINVSDLQMLINFAIYPEGYYRYQLFNWAAANLIGADGDDPEVINVQDVVAEINLLLDQYIMPVIHARQQHALRHVQQEEDDEVQATLDIADGQLVLTTSVPVAAMHLQLAADDTRWQAAVGLMSHRQRDGRHVFYSLTGDQLSAGTHVLAEVGSAQLEYAMLAAPDGQPIRCAIRQQDATGISNLPATDADSAERYTLSGMRTKSQAKGIYLVRSAGERMQGKNGKKYIVK